MTTNILQRENIKDLLDRLSTIVSEGWRPITGKIVKDEDFWSIELFYKPNFQQQRNDTIIAAFERSLQATDPEESSPMRSTEEMRQAVDEMIRERERARQQERMQELMRARQRDRDENSIDWNNMPF